MRYVVRWNRPGSGFGAFVIVNRALGREDAKAAALRDVIEPGATNVQTDLHPLDEHAVYLGQDECSIDARVPAQGAA